LAVSVGTRSYLLLFLDIGLTWGTLGVPWGRRDWLGERVGMCITEEVWHVLPDDGSGVVRQNKAAFSSGHHESEMWQGLYRLEIEVVWTLRGATGR
jgi:hypothetical protein